MTLEEFTKEFDAKMASMSDEELIAALKKVGCEFWDSDGFRTCQFCGCRTNAKMRRCCPKGTEKDENRSINICQTPT